jgi:hypothetical protein
MECNVRVYGYDERKYQLYIVKYDEVVNCKPFHCFKFYAEKRTCGIVDSTRKKPISSLVLYK